MTQVAYISFTTSDLTPQMEVVKKAFESIKVTPRVTAASSAQTEPTVDVCYADVEACDIFIGLVGHKLGWVPEHSSNRLVHRKFNDQVD